MLKKKKPHNSFHFSHLLVELGVENRSIAGVVLMLPDAVDTGEAAVVEDVEGFLESSFRRCSCREEEKKKKFVSRGEFWYLPQNTPMTNQRQMCFMMPILNLFKTS